MPDNQSIHNVFSFLDWAGIKITKDVFANKFKVAGVSGYHELTDDLVAKVWGRLQKMDFRIPKPKLEDFLQTKALDYPFHPVKDYLNALQWDGVQRLEALLPKYYDAEDNEYTRAVGKIIMVAGVKRIFEPGCKFDQTLSVGGQAGQPEINFVTNIGRKMSGLLMRLSLEMDHKRCWSRWKENG